MYNFINVSLIQQHFEEVILKILQQFEHFPLDEIPHVSTCKRNMTMQLSYFALLWATTFATVLQVPGYRSRGPGFELRRY
jgi:hypothetical protein